MPASAVHEGRSLLHRALVPRYPPPSADRAPGGRASIGNRIRATCRTCPDPSGARSLTAQTCGDGFEITRPSVSGQPRRGGISIVEDGSGGNDCRHHRQDSKGSRILEPPSHRWTPEPGRTESSNRRRPGCGQNAHQGGSHGFVAIIRDEHRKRSE